METVAPASYPMSGATGKENKAGTSLPALFRLEASKALAALKRA
jgi:hypothetical protein